MKSSVRRLGENTARGVLVFYVLCFVLALATAWAGGLGPLFLPPAALFGLHLSNQAAKVRLEDPVGALALFKSNPVAGLALFLALAAGAWTGPQGRF